MNIIKNFFNLIKYDKSVSYYLKKLIKNFSYKSLSDLGTCLCDAEDKGIKIILNSVDSIKLGRTLLLQSYNQHPDTVNAFALQIALLERNNDFQTVSDMSESAKVLNNSFVINNIAYAKYNLGLFEEALDLQKYAVKIDIETDYRHILLQYNLLLFELSCGYNNLYKYDLNKFLEMLICDDVYDYESAIIFAIFTDNYNFVKHNIDIYNKTFIAEKEALEIINNYMQNKIKPTASDVLKVIKPKTVYGKALYDSAK